MPGAPCPVLSARTGHGTLTFPNPMAYDPTKPVAGTDLDAVEMRSQLQGLDAKIPTGAVVDSVTLNGPGSGAGATVTLSAGVLHFTFAIPEGMPGAQGNPGEVTQSQLSNDLSNTANFAISQTLPLTSANTNSVAGLGLTVSDPPTQAEVQSLANKLDELISTARR